MDDYTLKERYKLISAMNCICRYAPSDIWELWFSKHPSDDQSNTKAFLDDCTAFEELGRDFFFCDYCDLSLDRNMTLTDAIEIVVSALDPFWEEQYRGHLADELTASNDNQLIASCKTFADIIQNAYFNDELFDGLIRHVPKRFVAIDWDIFFFDVMQKLRGLPVTIATEYLDLPISEIEKLRKDNQKFVQLIYEKYSNSADWRASVMGLPTTVIIPGGISSLKNAVDWLLEKYKYPVVDFVVETDIIEEGK